MNTKQDVAAWLEAHRQDFIEMADAIWGNPETAFREFFASSLQADFLERQGFRVTRDIAGINTAFLAEWGSGAPIIGFAGEYDALPGLSQKAQPVQEPLAEGGAGHGCGHNLLGTAHVAAVTALKRWMEANRVPGTLRYYGCPAEESGAAKTFMARAGLFDDLAAAFNFHPMYANTACKGSMVGWLTRKFRFHGKTAHAGASPHLGRSALDAVELMNVGVNYLREHVTGDVRLHYVITQGGSAANIVPDEAESVHMVRALHPDTLKDVAERVSRIAQGAALMTGTQVEEVFVNALSSLLNNHCLSDLQYANMQELGPIQWTEEELAFARKINEGYPADARMGVALAASLPEALLAGDSPILAANYPAFDEGKWSSGSTDVGDLSWKTPLSMVTTSCWTLSSGPHSWGVVATGGMSIGHKGMLHAAKIMALSAMDLLTEPRHLERARTEFEQRVRAVPYVNPIPPEVQPPRFVP